MSQQLRHRFIIRERRMSQDTAREYWGNIKLGFSDIGIEVGTVQGDDGTYVVTFSSKESERSLDQVTLVFRRFAEKQNAIVREEP
jgi:hypothetical protein